MDRGNSRSSYMKKQWFVVAPDLINSNYDKIYYEENLEKDEKR